MVLPDVEFALLIDRGIHEESRENRRRSIDGHRYRRSRIDQIETGIQFLGVVQAADGNAGVACFTVDVGAVVRIASVQRHRIECRRKPFGGHAERNVVKTLVRAFRTAFTGEHAGRILAFALEWINARRIWEFTGNVFLFQPLQHVAPCFVTRR